jgi:hypothetical protein
MRACLRLWPSSWAAPSSCKCGCLRLWPALELGSRRPKTTPRLAPQIRRCSSFPGSQAPRDAPAAPRSIP